MSLGSLLSAGQILGILVSLDSVNLMKGNWRLCAFHFLVFLFVPKVRIPIQSPLPTSDDFPSDSGWEKCESLLRNLVALRKGVKVLEIAVSCFLLRLGSP